MSTTGAVPPAALGWDAGWAEVLAPADGLPARVVRVDRGWLRVRGPASGGCAEADVAVPQPVEPPVPVTGDWVAYDPHDEHPQVTAVAPRRTALVRRDPADHAPRPQVLSANMDEVWVVHSVDQPLRAGWLDRALVVAHGSDAAVTIVVAKADLTGADDDVASAGTLAPHVEVVATSAVDGRGVDTLRARLGGGRCAALLGRSGAGKTSLINALAGGGDERTGAVRAGDARGRHTTTRRSLVTVAGGTVIDTPGIRAIGLWEPAVGLARTFPQIARLARGCRFGDCSHRHEPGCAVQAALDAGELSRVRYDRMMTLSS